MPLGADSKAWSQLLNKQLKKKEPRELRGSIA